MKTTLSSAAEIKSKEIIEQIINSAVYDQTHQEDGTELELFTQRRIRKEICSW